MTNTTSKPFPSVPKGPNPNSRDTCDTCFLVSMPRKRKLSPWLKRRHRSSSFTKSRILNLHHGGVNRYNATLLETNINRFGEMFVSRNNKKDFKRIPIAAPEQLYSTAFKQHTKVKQKFVVAKDISIPKTVSLSKRTNKKRISSGISFSSGVDSTWLALKLLLEKKRRINSLYLFHCKNLNGYTNARETIAAEEVHEKLKTLFPLVSIVLISFAIPLQPHPSLNLDSSRTLVLTTRNQNLLLYIGKEISERNLPVSNLFFNCDVGHSEYFSDNVEAYQSFQPIMSAYFGFKLNLVNVECASRGSLVEEKASKIKMLIDYGLFSKTSFCTAVRWFAKNRKDYLNQMRSQRQVPFHKQSCSRCLKCKLYIEAYKLTIRNVV